MARQLLLICLVGMAVGHGPALAESIVHPETRVDLGVSVSDFTWAEYGDDGNRLLKEEGTRYGLDVDVSSLYQRFGWQGGAGAFFGEADYDGRTWSQIPVKTDALYVGADCHGDGVICFRPFDRVVLKSFAGLGIDAWLRDLDDTRTATGVPVQGAEEWWGCVYGRLGLGGSMVFRTDWEVFASGGVKLPIYARNEADFQLSGSERAGLEPEMTVSGFGEAGLRRGRLGIRLVCDFLRFDRSDSVSAGTYNMYQPESKADVYTMQVFWTMGK